MRRDAKSVMVAVCTVCKVRMAPLLSETRRAQYVEARRVAAYVMVERRKLSLVQAGRCMERDHTTLLHHVRRVNARLRAGDTKLAEKIEAVDRMARGIYERRTEEMSCNVVVTCPGSDNAPQPPPAPAAVVEPEPEPEPVTWGGCEAAYLSAITTKSALPTHWRNSGHKYKVKAYFNAMLRQVLCIESAGVGVEIDADEWEAVKDAADRALAFGGEHPEA